MRKIRVVLACCLALGTACSLGPEHLPALYAQRDQFQRLIDEVLDKMAKDREWWAGLSPERREYWKDFLEKVRAEEKERALNAINSLAEGPSAIEPGPAR